MTFITSPVLPQSRPAVLHKVHLTGALLFLFIPLVLFLFLRYPFGILPSLFAALGIMFGHRFLAIPFMERFKNERCLWCGRTSRPRKPLILSGKEFQLCVETCKTKALRFFDFCRRNRPLIAAGIFLPLCWYVVTMLGNGFGLFSFPQDWDRFLFQFFIAITVASISFLYGTGSAAENPGFSFPIHNLFLLGIKNTLLVFRYVGIWWIAVSLIFLSKKLGLNL